MTSHPETLPARIIDDDLPTGNSQDGSAGNLSQLTSLACIYPSAEISATSKGAVSRALAQLLEWAAEEFPGIDIVAACPGGGDVARVRYVDPQLSDFQRLVYRVLRQRIVRTFIPSRLLPDLQRLHARRGVASLIGEFGVPEVVICTTLSGPVAARAKMKDARIIYWIHRAPLMGQELDVLNAVRCADVVVVNSRALYDVLFQVICRNEFRAPVWIIEPYVNFRPRRVTDDDERNAMRSELGLGPTDIAIAHIGRSPAKGLQIVEHALALCTNTDRKVVLLSAGGKRPFIRWIAPNVEIRELGILSWERLAKLYQSSDLGVVPSVWFESFGLVTLEMMSAGLCVIGSRVGGIEQVIDNEVNGFLVDRPNDVQQWATVMQRLMDNPRLRCQIGSVASHWAEDRFTRDQFLEGWGRLFDSFLPDHTNHG